MILALNCTEEVVQVVLGLPDRVVASLEIGNGSKVNSVLAPAVDTMLRGAGIRPRELAVVACVRGPGSFTGVRLGLAFASGLCLAAGVPLAGLDYLPLLAANALAGPDGGRVQADRDEQAGPTGPDISVATGAGETPDPQGPPELHVLTYSRRAKVYHQAFAGTQPLGPPLDLPVDQALALVNARAASPAGGRLLAVGSGLWRNVEVFEALSPRFERLPHINPTPEILLQAAHAAQPTGPPMDALYLRGSDAEENLTGFAAQRGLDAAEAQRRMEKALG